MGAPRRTWAAALLAAVPVAAAWGQAAGPRVADLTVGAVEVLVDGRPAATLVAGVTATVRTRAQNHGPAPARATVAELLVDGRAVASLRLGALGPAQARVASFPWTAGPPGRRVVAVRITPAAGELDPDIKNNVRSRPVSVVPPPAPAAGPSPLAPDTPEPGPPTPAPAPPTPAPVPSAPPRPPRLLALEPSRVQAGSQVVLTLRGEHLAGARVETDDPRLRVLGVERRHDREVGLRLQVASDARHRAYDLILRGPGGEHVARRVLTVEPSVAAVTLATDVEPDRVVAVLAASAAAAALAVVRDLEAVHRLRRVELHRLASAATVLVVFRIGDGRDPEAVAAALETDPRVLLAQPNRRVRGAAPEPARAPLAELQYALGALRLPEAHRRATGRGVRVALVDTAVEAAHPELRDRVEEQADFVGGEPASRAHGTAVAGVIAAAPDNGEGIVGVAPGVRLLALRALDRNGRDPRQLVGTSVGVARALDHATLRRVGAINLSLGGGPDRLLAWLVERAVAAGIVVVAAAGNDGPDAPPVFPAALEPVIAVTAVDAREARWPGAGRGAHIDLAAPGVEVMTPAERGAYALRTGTSLAAAHVTGVVALLLERQPALTPAEVRARLEATARDLGAPGRDPDFGAGLVDAARALE